ncbi:DUF2062 domain-containing protein [Arcobacter sp. CECT 8983]|uniref:DUF2062 domain-containing protein n=1 Tax=Arcobacter sp. CECT 8983 TaxID=2044508 RepID=UPI0013E995AC|nr:DUF2062 domain-containing protein [Arcobacter sp. CECT 8983]
MPRKKLKKVLPTHEKIQAQRFLKIFGKFLHKRELWSVSRRKVVGGVLIGIFVACLPMPLQMVLSTLLAIYFNVNLPISFALIFISNPITMPPLFYFEYKLGNLILGNTNPVEFNFHSMYDNFEQIASSLWTGALVFGVFSSVICSIFVNFFWIASVKKQRRR